MDNYNWWTDPKNKEEVDRLSWWNHSENKTFFQLPISAVQSGEYWVASFNEDTEAIFGDSFSGCAQGDTREGAIRRLFLIVKYAHEFSEDRRRNYERFVPFQKGDWNRIGGRWFKVFGVHFSFRYGNGMKGGKYIPFTKLNISTYSSWRIYKQWKRKLVNSEPNHEVCDATKAK